MGTIFGFVFCCIIDAYCLELFPKNWFKKKKD
jgi:hypothetical protein